MTKRRLGSFLVNPVGLGCMNMSHVYGGIPESADRRSTKRNWYRRVQNI